MCFKKINVSCYFRHINFYIIRIFKLIKSNYDVCDLLDKSLSFFSIIYILYTLSFNFAYDFKQYIQHNVLISLKTMANKTESI
jgi:hypothetical protein